MIDSFNQFVDKVDSIEEIDIGLSEQSTMASTSTGGVDNPDGPRVFSVKRDLGKPCIEVDSDTYSKCVQGKVPFRRWSKYIDDPKLGKQMRSIYAKHKKVLIKDGKTGSMAYLK